MRETKAQAELPIHKAQFAKNLTVQKSVHMNKNSNRVTTFQ